MIRSISLVSIVFSIPFLLLTVRYNYSHYGRVIHSAPGMTYAASFNQATLGVDLLSPEDIKVYDDSIYVIDSRTNTLIVLSDTFVLTHELNTFSLNPLYEQALHQQGITDITEVTLNGPMGLDVKESGIYIADTSNFRIVKLNHNYEVIGLFSHIDDPTFNVINFEPRKITVDSSERMYVVAKNVYEGIIEISSNGDFNRFTGVNPLNPNPLEILRRSFMTEAQLAQLSLFLPTEYTNVAMDHRSFIYATSKPSGSNADNTIQLINPKGIDVLIRNGYHPPMGDIHFVIGQNKYVITGPSDLVSIAYTDNNIYTVLDQRRSRLFTYDSQGNLLYINGDKGAQSDRFVEGVALAYLRDDLIVLDRATRTLIVYRLTEFGASVNLAISYHEMGKFDQAAAIWEDVLEMNSNYEIAYNGIGKHHLRENQYKIAMEYFALGHDYYYYSKAFQLYRNTMIKDNFVWIMSGSFVVMAGIFALKITKIRKKGGSLLYED